MQRVPTDITPEIIQRHGLTDEEFEQILKHLGREPNLTELGIFSVMWSEHCSYKSSRIHLKRFPTEGERVVQGPGENAGAVDIGDGLSAVFKMESHNHPSFIEPFQGAATGVGGILRDIFTMGARPIALLDSLRFGELDLPKNRHLLKGVVSGISWYGNCIGVPTVGGEIAFNDIYAKNPLVNVFCLGIVKTDQLLRGHAGGVGNPVLYIGAKTGRDGIHGATMASDSFDDASEQKRPNVQVGDPFLEKLLLEACLEFLDQRLLVGIQDMGAAGLTSSSCEMASRAGTGIELELADVPRREPDMTPYELMLSESQERMLLVADAGKEDRVIAICRKWGIDAAVIGKVTNDGFIRIKEQGTVVAEIPAKALVDESPKYERPAKPPEYQDLLQSLTIENLPDVRDAEERPAPVAGFADHCRQSLGLSSIRPHGGHRYHCPAGFGCGRGAYQRHEQGLGHDNGRQQPVLPLESIRGRHPDRGGSGPKPRVLRGATHRGDGLPEFRESRAAGHHVAVRVGRRRRCRCVSHVRHPRCQRQRQPV